MPSHTGAEWSSRRRSPRRSAQLFDGHYAVIILDSDFTTFAEVEGACIELFGFTPEEAAALAMKVHTTGEALAAVLRRGRGTQAGRGPRSRNSRSWSASVPAARAGLSRRPEGGPARRR